MTEVKKRELLALAERCETETGPNYDLEVGIWRAVFGSDGRSEPADDPLYTVSLDAAMTLVPSYCDMRSFNDGPSGTSWTLGEFTRGVVIKRGRGVTGGHYALALCAAALRARAAECAS